MDRSLLLLILALGSVWLILDDFNGKKRISRFIASVIPAGKPLLGEGSRIHEEQKKDQGTVTGIPKQGLVTDPNFNPYEVK